MPQEDLAAWGERCPCHECYMEGVDDDNELGNDGEDEFSWRRRRLGRRRRAVKRHFQPEGLAVCPMAGRRAPELAIMLGTFGYVHPMGDHHPLPPGAPPLHLKGLVRLVYVLSSSTIGPWTPWN